MVNSMQSGGNATADNIAIDNDPEETREWLEALSEVQGPKRYHIQSIPI